MIFQKVQNSLLIPSNLSQHDLANVLDVFSSHQIDYGDLYFQLSQDESWSLENGIITEGGFNIDRGVGVRAISGEKTGFAYADQIDLANLMQCAQAVKNIGARSERSKLNVINFKQGKFSQNYDAINPLDNISSEEKITLLRMVDSTARQYPEVTQVNAHLSAIYEEIIVAGTDGTLGADIRPLVRLSISVLVEKDGKREMGRSGFGGRYPLSYLWGEENGEVRAKYYTQEAVRQALTNIEAQPAPSGTMPVVLGAGWCGVLLHEAVGHGLEGDFNRKGSSLFSGKIGEQVTSPLCTIIDNGTIPNRRGSLNIDDEGTPAQCNVLIENGILKGYMQDKLNARLMGQKPTGNARRESYAHLPMPRMTNTYMQAGAHELEEMIASVDFGIFATNFGGGQVDITSGNFTFSTAEAYAIENGKITHSIKGATLIGSGIEVMQKVSMVGKTMELDRGVGVCGKAGQSVPVGVGQPEVKIDALTVGGSR